MKAIGGGTFIDMGIDERDQEIESLKAENRRLQRAVTDAEVEAKRAREDANRALSMLRRQLSPLYRALQAVFGELDDAGVTDGPVPVHTAGAAPVAGEDARLKNIWDSWKERLGPTCAKVIDALLLQSEMTNRQIAVAIGTGRIQTVYDAVTKMNKVSLLTKNGDRYSLKQL
jgi:FtsZ-binding cell division protein ZapB